MIRSLGRAAPGALAPAFVLALAGPALAQDVALRVGHLVPGGDAPALEGATLLVRGGRVVALGHAVEVPEGVPVVERPGAWLVPGFVDCATGLGARGERDDLTRALDDDLTAAHLLDPRHRDLAAARAAGTTTALLSPGDRSPVAGAAVVLATTGVQRGDDRAALVKLTLAPSAWRGSSRAPTSRAGAVALLRAAVEAAHGPAPEGGAPGGLLAGWARGERAALFTVGTPLDLRLARGLTGPFGLRTLFRLDPGLGEGDLPLGPAPGLGPDAGADVVAVVGPWDLDVAPRVAALAGALARAGVPVVFASEAPARRPEALRVTAALAVAHGLDPRAAFDGLTARAAAALGVGDRVGALAPGLDADFVLLDGPPLDLAARVLETWVAGRRVFRAAPAQGQGGRP